MSNIYNINIRESDSKKIIDFYDKAMKELIQFYGINWIDNTPVVYVVDSRKDYNTMAGHSTEDWEVGKAYDDNKLLLLSPNSYERESRHKYSDNEYYSLIKHELSHLFFNIFSRSGEPLWLNEGFAIYVSDQLGRKKRPKVFKNFLKYYSNEDKGIYEEVGFVVEGLIKRYGKEKVVGFLRGLCNINSEDSFKKEFEKYFGIELGYGSYSFEQSSVASKI